MFLTQSTHWPVYSLAHLSVRWCFNLGGFLHKHFLMIKRKINHDSWVYSTFNSETENMHLYAIRVRSTSRDILQTKPEACSSFFCLLEVSSFNLKPCYFSPMWGYFVLFFCLWNTKGDFFYLHNLFTNSAFVLHGKKYHHVSLNDMKESKQWQNCPFWVNCSFTRH